MLYGYSFCLDVKNQISLSWNFRMISFFNVYYSNFKSIIFLFQSNNFIFKSWKSCSFALFIRIGNPQDISSINEIKTTEFLTSLTKKWHFFSHPHKINDNIIIIWEVYFIKLAYEIYIFILFHQSTKNKIVSSIYK